MLAIPMERLNFASPNEIASTLDFFHLLSRTCIGCPCFGYRLFHRILNLFAGHATGVVMSRVKAVTSVEQRIQIFIKAGATGLLALPSFLSIHRVGNAASLMIRSEEI